MAWKAKPKATVDNVMTKQQEPVHPLDPGGPWQVRKLVLSRPKQVKTAELVKHQIQERFLKAADPELEWYIQVSVHLGGTVTFVGEVELPSKGEDEPNEALSQLVARAHRRAEFFNINGIELDEPNMVYKDYERGKSRPESNWS